MLAIPVRHLWLSALSIIGMVVVANCSASAQTTITIDNSRTTQVAIDGDDIVIVTSFGSISTTGGLFNHAIRESGSNNTVISNGTLSTSGPGAAGIASLTFSNADITNNGAISTFDVQSDGILASNSFNGIITNNGTIRSFGSFSSGINLSGGINFTVNNTGFITTTGDDALGFLTQALANSNTFFNSGYIRTKGSSAEAVLFIGATNNSLTNSGLLVAEQPDSNAISTSSANGTIDLRAPSYIGGDIVFTGNTDLNITTGPSHSVFWQLPTTNVIGGQANISGTVPWFYNTTTGELATYDPTGLAGTFNQLGDTARTLSSLGRQGLASTQQDASGGTASPTAASAYAASDPSTRAVEATFSRLVSSYSPSYGFDAGALWVNGFGGVMEYDATTSTLEQDLQHYGVAAGYAWQHDANTRLGVMTGYISGQIDAQSRFADAQDIASNGFFVGFQGDHDFGSANVGFGLIGGWQTHDSDRFVNDNLAQTGGLTLGISSAAASYDSWFLTPELSMSTDFGFGTDTVITPSARVRYAMQSVGGYSETGSSANATVDGYTMGLLEGELELAVTKHLERGSVTGRLGYIMRNAVGNDSADVSMALSGTTIANQVDFGDTEGGASFVGANIEVHLSENATFNVDGQATVSGDVFGLQGSLALSLMF